MRRGSVIYLLLVTLMWALSMLAFWWASREQKKLYSLPTRPTELTVALYHLNATLRAAGTKLEALADYLETSHATRPQETE